MMRFFSLTLIAGAAAAEPSFPWEPALDVFVENGLAPIVACQVKFDPVPVLPVVAGPDADANAHAVVTAFRTFQEVAIEVWRTASVGTLTAEQKIALSNELFQKANTLKAAINVVPQKEEALTKALECVVTEIKPVLVGINAKLATLGDIISKVAKPLAGVAKNALQVFFVYVQYDLNGVDFHCRNAANGGLKGKKGQKALKSFSKKWQKFVKKLEKLSFVKAAVKAVKSRNDKDGEKAANAFDKVSKKLNKTLPHMEKELTTLGKKFQPLYAALAKDQFLTEKQCIELVKKSEKLVDKDIIEPLVGSDDDNCSCWCIVAICLLLIIGALIAAFLMCKKKPADEDMDVSTSGEY